ncbi:DinB family protein [Phaeobacter marinintestinus]|uniref:DinB family protein n=1 Tax=Falsiphaeobacter marinintestinus TaxID=1492905 RepID=UPI0011B81F0A|nr:DinB family protein [Phaeobacter marinintestinus]
MITRDYCIMMARYNAWQNNQLLQSIQVLPEVDLMQDRQAFFGSIMGTLSHLLWGDLMWMARFDGGDSPAVSISDSPSLTPSYADWCPARLHADKRILEWADAVEDVTLAGDLTWFSSSIGAQMTRPFAMCAVHMFNHQTHHRGQIHGMLTAAGAEAPVSDLVMMPEA